MQSCGWGLGPPPYRRQPTRLRLVLPVGLAARPSRKCLGPTEPPAWRLRRGSTRRGKAYLEGPPSLPPGPLRSRRWLRPSGTLGGTLQLRSPLFGLLFLGPQHTPTACQAWRCTVRSDPPFSLRIEARARVRGGGARCVGGVNTVKSGRPWHRWPLRGAGLGRGLADAVPAWAHTARRVTEPSAGVGVRDRLRAARGCVQGSAGG